jgi:hypothetical protein
LGPGLGSGFRTRARVTSDRWWRARSTVAREAACATRARARVSVRARASVRARGRGRGRVRVRARARGGLRH